MVGRAASAAAAARCLCASASSSSNPFLSASESQQAGEGRNRGKSEPLTQTVNRPAPNTEPSLCTPCLQPEAPSDAASSLQQSLCVQPTVSPRFSDTSVRCDDVAVRTRQCYMLRCKFLFVMRSCEIACVNFPQ